MLVWRWATEFSIACCFNAAPLGEFPRISTVNRTSIWRSSRHTYDVHGTGAGAGEIQQVSIDDYVYTRSKISRVIRLLRRYFATLLNRQSLDLQLTTPIRISTYKLSLRFYNPSELPRWTLYCRISTAVKEEVRHWMSWWSTCMLDSLMLQVSRLTWYRYKGMAASANSSGKPSTRGSTLTPQSTGAGFSQIGGRAPSADNSGGAMSVLLSWHEKVVEIAGLGTVTRSITDWRKV